MDRFTWLQEEFGGNSIFAYLLAMLGVLMALLLRKFFSKLLSRLIYRLIRKKPEFSALRSFESLLSGPFQWILTLLVVYAAFSSLRIPVSWELETPEKPGLMVTIQKMYALALIASFTFLAVRLVDFFSREFLQKAEDGDRLLDKQLLPFIRELLKILLIIISFFSALVLYSNLMLPTSWPALASEVLPLRLQPRNL